MDARTLATAMGNTLSFSRYEQLTPAFNSALAQAGCTTINRAAMFAAQIGHESVGLKYGEEIATGAAYEWRKDLGNVYAGDGRRFKGHGWLQITGRHNHTQVSKWAHSKGYVPSPTYFVDHPTELASDRYVWIGPVWYWTVARPNLNAQSDRGDIVAATKSINGGTNGLTDRRNRWNRCRGLGNALLPSGGVAAAAATRRVIDPAMEEENHMLLPAGTGQEVSLGVPRTANYVQIDSSYGPLKVHQITFSGPRYGPDRNTADYRYFPAGDPGTDDLANTVDASRPWLIALPEKDNADNRPWSMTIRYSSANEHNHPSAMFTA